MSKPLHIGIVAGEASGDILGAGLIRAIKQHYPDAVFEGIGGARMIKEGFQTLVPMERLSVMGLVEVLGRLFELLRIRKNLLAHFSETRPDIFIGIDAPDFNLQLERKLKSAGIKTVQYVAPQVWAWRQSRVKTIGASADLVLALFPFEAEFYGTHNVPVSFVGHPMADEIDYETPKAGAREALGIGLEDRVLALLPGSRSSEVQRLGDVFLSTAARCQKRLPGCRVLVAAANDRIAGLVEDMIAQHPELGKVEVMSGQSRRVMAAADVLLVASGTVTLEAALLKRPMVVAYKLAPLTYWLAQRLVKIKNVALPNLLASEPRIPEFIQHEANPETLSAALIELFSEDKATEQTREFLAIHKALRQDASSRAAEAVLALVNQ